MEDKTFEKYIVRYMKTVAVVFRMLIQDIEKNAFIQR